MSLIAWVGVKGARGASTGGLAVAGVWPPTGRRVLFAELDPAGGDVAASFGLFADPGLVQLGAGFRHAVSAEEVWSNAQTLPGGTPVVVAPPSAHQGHALGQLWEHLGPVLAALPNADVIADCGRLEPGSPALEVARHAHLVVLVARPTLNGVAHLRSRIATRVCDAPIGVVLIGDHPYSAAEVETATGVKVIGVLADDERGAAMLNGEPGSPAALGRSSLVRSARGIAAAIAGVVDRRPASAQRHRAPSQRHEPASVGLGGNP